MNDAYLPGNHTSTTRHSNGIRANESSESTGAAVLAHSLRDCGTTKKLACLVVQDGLLASTIEELQSLYNYVIPIEPIPNPQPANLYLMNRPDLLYTFTKIHLWRQVQFRKIVYIDADVVALRAPEELFDIPDSFAAAPDVGWPDAFNSGVMVLTPHMGEYYALRGLANSGDSFDGADQGLLNQYYENRPWKRLSFTYNTTPSANYQYEPAYRYWKRNITLVHFIGKDKPWHRAREEKGAPNAFQEMLSRWWAVYDRHFHISTSDYISGRRNPVTEYVQGQQVAPSESLSAAGYPVATTQPAPPPQPFPAQDQPYYTPHQGVDSPKQHQQHQQHDQPPHHHSHHHAGTATPSFTERGEPAENLAQGHQQPVPTVEQRKFSAPHMEWDATRGAPPIDARPEAADFPTTTYEFNTNPAPFRPPPSYPEPPKDMYYQVPPPPSHSAPKPKPIFPWEERGNSRPTRRFIEDEAAPSPPELETEAPYVDELEVSTDQNIEPVTPTIKVTDDPWTSFAQQKNAWDEVNGINDYVRALTAFQKNRGKVQVVQENVPSIGIPTTTNVQQHVLSPSNGPKPEALIEKVEQARKRRESLILTDFPTADDRPSLPVTPAPRRRSTFWGDEGRDDEADLPPAEGVPDQADWDPNVQLENLRRSSLIGPGDLNFPGGKPLPKRTMPTTAVPIPEHALNHPHVPIANSGDGADERSVDYQQVHYVAGASGGSSPHGLDTLVKGHESHDEYFRSASGVLTSEQSDSQQSDSRSKSQDVSFGESSTISESDQTTSSSSADSSRDQSQQSDDWTTSFRPGAQQTRSERKPFSEFSSSSFSSDTRTTSNFFSGSSESTSNTTSNHASSFMTSIVSGDHSRLSETERNTALNAASGSSTLPGSFPTTHSESSDFFQRSSGDESSFFGKPGFDKSSSGAVDEVEAKRDGKDFPGMPSDEPMSLNTERKGVAFGDDQ
ncbi:hypothetical protein AC578_519 [Pseudocercospora eumusae]|uniref:glycogenin glucosyltransferase n=1 Tax=Pseudocercospora eumusae TaxID=321146 RepID=A0A139HY39_9PEZI|nr:hypothetical protein AC578_519 [Pseudocercospora eumusae]